MKTYKVVCKDDINTDGMKMNITKGKSYDVIMAYIGDLDIVYSITNDVNIRASYTQCYFKSISDIREEKLNELGIK